MIPLRDNYQQGNKQLKFLFIHAVLKITAGQQ